MRTIEVPLMVMGKKFVVPVEVKTPDDYPSLFGGDNPSPNIDTDRIKKKLEGQATTEAQRGNAMVQLVTTFLATLTAEKKDLVLQKLTEYRNLRDWMRGLERENPTLWAGEFTKELQQADRRIEWYELLHRLVSLPFPWPE